MDVHLRISPFKIFNCLASCGGKGLSRFRESDIIPFVPFLEVLLVFTQLGLFFTNTGKQPKRWK
nr:hypothetical protein [Nonlabens ulvanivorans]